METDERRKKFGVLKILSPQITQIGGALAALAAIDIVGNFSSSYSELYMYNFAPPNISTAIFVSPTQFLESFQSSVPNSYSVINAADIVPILPPDSVPLGSGFTFNFYQAVSSSNILTYCAQLLDIGDNHSLSENYLPFVTQLAIPG